MYLMSEWKSITICLPRYFDIWIGIILFNFLCLRTQKKNQTKKSTQTKEKTQTKPKQSKQKTQPNNKSQTTNKLTQNNRKKKIVSC